MVTEELLELLQFNRRWGVVTLPIPPLDTTSEFHLLSLFITAGPSGTPKFPAAVELHHLGLQADIVRAGYFAALSRSGLIAALQQDRLKAILTQID